MAMSTSIRFPQGPIATPQGFITLEWQQWFQNPQFLSFSFANPVAVTSGGTGLASGTSGGIPAFTSSTTMASSAVLGANQIVLGGGAGATPASLGSTGTATTVLHGNASGFPTFGAVNLAADVSGLLPATNGGTGSSSVSPNIVFAGPSSGAATTPGFRALVPADLSMTPITGSISVDVSLNNTANYFDGPTIAQGTAGTWFVSGTVTLVDTAGAAQFHAKMSDGSTVLDSAAATSQGLNGLISISLSGFLSSPAGNFRISVRDTTSTSGKIIANQTGTSKDSTITAIRIG